MKVLADALLLPPISWFSIIKNADVVYLDPNFLYRKQTYKNRFEILTNQGKQKIVLPMVHPCTDFEVDKIFLADIENEIKTVKSKLQSAYGKSPWFSFLNIEFSEILSILSKKDSLFKIKTIYICE